MLVAGIRTVRPWHPFSDGARRQAGVVALMVCLRPVSGGIVTYVTPSEAMTSNANWFAVNGT
ncbi:MAG: hypothetical protein ACK6D0_21500 [Planctomyces sp.]